MEFIGWYHTLLQDKHEIKNVIVARCSLTKHGVFSSFVHSLISANMRNTEKCSRQTDGKGKHWEHCHFGEL